ncbi:MAG TPA: hypothetical protein VGL99_15300 [Chloroflexota bacterium]
MKPRPDGEQPRERCRDLRQIAEDYSEGVVERDPILATFYGDYRYNDRLPDIDPEGRAKEEAALRAIHLASSRLPRAISTTRTASPWTC